MHCINIYVLVTRDSLCEFNGQSALTDNIIHIAETILALGNHVDKLFLYITDLNQYLIVLSLLCLRCHAINANFGFNTLIMFLLFCLTVMVSGLIDLSRQSRVVLDNYVQR